MFEYRVVPAPKKGIKAKGIRTNEERFAFAMSELLNQMATDGWDYQRAETLPAEERSGLTGKTTVFKNMLIFRRAVDAADPEESAAPEIDEALAPTATATRVLPSVEEANQLPENHVSAPKVETAAETS